MDVTVLQCVLGLSLMAWYATPVLLGKCRNAGSNERNKIHSRCPAPEHPTNSTLRGTTPDSTHRRNTPVKEMHYSGASGDPAQTEHSLTRRTNEAAGTQQCSLMTRQPSSNPAETKPCCHSPKSHEPVVVPSLPCSHSPIQVLDGTPSHTVPGHNSRHMQQLQPPLQQQDPQHCQRCHEHAALADKRL